MNHRAGQWFFDKVWILAIVAAAVLASTNSWKTWLRKYSWLLVLSAAVIVTLIPFRSTFSVTCTTETLELSHFIGQHSQWYFKNVQLYATVDSAPEQFTGSIELENGDSVVIQRISSGPLKIAISSQDASGGYLGRISKPNGDSKKLNGYAVIVIPSLDERAKQGENVLLPFVAQVDIGTHMLSDVAPSMAHLREANVIAIGHSLWGESLFKGDEAKLSPGDSISIEEPQGPAIGFLVADERVALKATYTQLGTRVRISRPPGSGYTLETSVVDRIKNDGLLQSIWAAALFIWGVPKLWSRANG